MKFGIRVHYQL